MEEFRVKLEKGARAGDAEAQLQLGQLLLYPPDGMQVEKDNAAYMLIKAAEQGRCEAYSVLGYFYMESHIDYTEARKWHLLGIETGQPSSETALSWMYFNALGIPHDKAKAYDLAARAAERKYLPAMVNMGRYYAGDDVIKLPPDFQPEYVKAASWYDKAAKLGDARAAFYLGRLIWSGQVPGRDRKEARALLQWASGQGLGAAKKMIADIDMEKE